MKGLILLAAAALLYAQDLETVKREPNLEKRSELALDHAGAVLTEIRTEIDKKEWSRIASELVEFRAAVDLSVQSLKDTGKKARRSPKYFKKAEVKLRELGRRLKGLQIAIDVDDRPKLEELMEHVGKLQDELVEMTMGVQ